MKTESIGKRRKHNQIVFTDSEDEEKEVSGLILEVDNKDISTKVAVAIASPSVVTVLTRGVPAKMAKYYHWWWSCPKEKGKDIIFWGSGTIIECEEDVVTHAYLCTIITAASLFERTNGLEPHQIQVDVYLSENNKLFCGKVLACDFHYNLAAIQIRTDSPLPIATLRDLDDVLPIHPIDYPQERSFKLLPYSNSFKIFPGTKIISLWRSTIPHNALRFYSAVFGTTSLKGGLDFDELYWIRDPNGQAEPNIREKVCGGPIINCSGEVIGIAFYGSPFLPSNIISRWWKHFKTCRQYRRPWLGMKFANLHSMRLELLGDFIRKFPNINTGVVVTEAPEDSPAYCSGIRAKDVIVECNGKSVCSKMELFDIIWDKVGESVEVTVLRASGDGEKFKLSLTVGETPPDNFYEWPRTSWVQLRVR